MHVDAVIESNANMPGKEETMKISDVVSRDPEIVSGAAVFKGTRVPVEALFENLAGGTSLGEFLKDFPTVERAQAEAAIVLAAQILEADFRAAQAARS